MIEKGSNLSYQASAIKDKRERMFFKEDKIYEYHT